MIAAQVTVTSNVSAMTERLQRQLHRGLAVVANRLKDQIIQSIRITNQGGMLPAGEGESPHFGIGDLLKSVKAVKRDDLEWHVGSFGDVATPVTGYAHQLEFGGQINVKSKEWLTIPVSEEAVRHKTQNRSAREFPRPLIFTMPGHKRVAYLVERTGKKPNDFVIHYVLRKSVNQAAHPFIRPAAVDPEFLNDARRIMSGQATGVTAEVMQ